MSAEGAGEIRILYLEDNPTDVDLVTETLAQEGLAARILSADTREGFLKLLRKGDYDVILSDYNLPSFDGLSALELARETRPGVPFIFVSGTIGEDRAVEVLKRGATDYVLKDRLSKLPMALRRALKELQESAHLKKMEAQFLQAQKMEAVGRLAGGVAHDFNNLLTVINGYSELVKAQLPAESALARDIEEIHKAGLRAAGLTRQLLAFSRKRVIEPVSLDLGGLVSGLEGMLGRLVGSDVRVASTQAPDLWRVTADPGQIEQVIVNLVANARDAMPKGGRITIDAVNVTLGKEDDPAHPEAKPGQYVLLTVSDTGVGMPADVLEHLFEPFFTTKEVGRGTGLGLSTVHGIVKQAGGMIEVTSNVGRGTTFSVYLPRGTKETRVRTRPAPAEAPDVGPATILLAEDQESVRRMAAAILESSGYKVLAAGDGAEALRMCEEYADPVHLLLSDLVMRTMTGVELAGLIRRHHPETRLLLMSGYAYRSEELHDLIAAGLPFLEKPFTVDGLKRKVREVLEGP